MKMSIWKKIYYWINRDGWTWKHFKYISDWYEFSIEK